MKVLVTGGAGFIGSHIVQSLSKQGANVLVYDNLSSGSGENTHGLPGVTLIEGDIMDAGMLTRAMAGVDVVSHQAAQLEITSCIENPISDLQVNTVGTLNVLKAMVENRISRLLVASSACVYGQAVYIPEDEANHPTNPNWEYGVSKLAAEKYCQIYSQNHGVRFTAFRYSIVYGPREWFGRVLTIFLNRLFHDEAPVIFGEGDQIRDFVYVDDVVRFHNLCLTTPATENQVFNVSTGIGTSVRELATLACEATGKAIDVRYENVPVGGRSGLVDGRLRLPAELRAMVLDPTKAKSITGWIFETQLRDGLRSEWDWLCRNPSRWTKMHF